MKIKRINILLVLSFLSFNISAGQQSYKIELVIFAQDRPTTEVFEQTESQIKWPRLVSNRSVYKSVNPEYMSLHGSYARLARGQNYQPIQHIAWIQSVQSNSLGRAVKISNQEGSLNGFFRLRRGHLVHMIIDLEYSTGSVIYRLHEKRRFKLNETHYLDHPKFGVLVRVSPLE